MHALLSDFHPPKVQLNSMSAVNNGEHDGGEAFVHIVGGEVQDGIELADLEGNGEAPMDGESDDSQTGSEAGDDEEMQQSADLEDDSIHAFEGHTAGVFAVAWSSTSPDLVATGGADDRAFLWRAGEDAYMESQGAVLELTGHSDTVSSLAFSKDGSLLASGGMDGCVRVWNAVDGACVQNLEGPGDAIEWVQWHPRGNVVLAGSADFTAWMWQAQTGGYMQVFSGHSGPVTCGAFTPDGRLVVTGGGAGDASLRTWDPKTGECKVVVQGPQFHAAGITSLAVHSDSTVALTGSEDGSAKLVALEGGRVVGTFSGHGEDQSVEAVAFLPGLPLAATAALDGKLIIWDIATCTARLECEHPEGITRIACHPTQPLVLTACIDGVVRSWDARTGACAHTFHGHAQPVQDLAVSPDGKMVISGSEDGSARVFSL